MNQEINEIYLSDVKSNPKGRCIDCWEFIPDQLNMKACHCKMKTGYVTMNALRKLACVEYREIIRPEYHDYLLSQGYLTKDILAAMKKARKQFPNVEGHLVLEVTTRDILKGLIS